MASIDRMMRLRIPLSAVALGLLLGGCLSRGGAERPNALSTAAPPAQADGGPGETQKAATQIVTQPARDIGIAGTEIPEVLERAGENPYEPVKPRGCRTLAAAMLELNEALGPDFDPDIEYKENRAGKLAEAGGKTIINSLIPFRGLVREISGAAPEQRRLNAAIRAGIARRGFLRGIYVSRRCRPRL